MKFANLCLILLVLCLGLGALGERLWFLDLLTHFTMQYALVALVLGMFFTVKKAARRSGLAFFCFVYTMILMSHVIDHRAPMVRIPKESARVRIFEFNTAGKEQVLQNWLPMHAALYDVVVLLEAQPHFQELMEKLKSEFPYQVSHLENSPFGIAVLSRWEITNTREFEAEGGFYPQYELSLRMPAGDEFLLFALHAPPPFAPQLAEAHEVILGELRQRLNDKKHPAVVVGDLNTTPYSHRFKELLKHTGLRDTTGLSPWANTWPAVTVDLWSLLGIRIDQCLVSNSFSIVERERIENLGSDHLPIKCVIQVEK